MRVYSDDDKKETPEESIARLTKELESCKKTTMYVGAVVVIVIILMAAYMMMKKR